MINIKTAVFIAGVALAVFLVPTAIAPSPLLQEAQARIGHPPNCTFPPCPWDDPDSWGWSSKGEKGGEGPMESIARKTQSTIENVGSKVQATVENVGTGKVQATVQNI